MAKRKMRERSLGQTAIPGQKDIAEKSLENYNDVFADIVNAMTNDDRYGEIYKILAEEGKEPQYMCRALDEIENRGMQKGMQKGMQMSLVKFVESLMERKRFQLREACTELGVTEAEYWKAKRTISVK